MGKRDRGGGWKKWQGHDAKRSRKEAWLTADDKVKGILFTVDPNKERLAKQEIQHLMSKYVDDDEEEEEEEEEEAEGKPGDSIAGMLAKELAEETEQRKKRREGAAGTTCFLGTGCKGNVFLQIDKDPVEAVLRICRGLQASTSPETRFVFRMVPVQKTTSALNEETIVATAGAMVDTLWEGGYGDLPPLVRYMVVFTKKNCTADTSSDGVKRGVAKLMPVGKSITDLQDPNTAIFCTILKSVACIGVGPQYGEYMHYNVHKLGHTKKEAPSAPGDKSDEPSPSSPS